MRSTLPMQKYDALDVMKWIGSWMVVVIHTSPLKPYSAIADMLTAQGVCRIAVPFFFAASAFLLFSKLDSNYHNDVLRIKHYCTRILRMYCVWSIVYLLLHILTYGISTAWNLAFWGSRLRLFFFEASHYHLWYLLATVYAVPLVYLLYHTGSEVILFAIVPPLWTLRCLQYTYGWVGIFRDEFLWLQTNCDVITNVFFCAVPLMSVGIIAMRRYKEHSNRQWGIRTTIWFVAYIVELIATYITSPQKVHFEYLFCAPILTYHLLCWLLTLEFSFKENNISIIFRRGSIWIYCIHPLFILLWDSFSEIVGIRRFVVVAFFSLLSSFAYVLIRNRKDRYKCA